MPPTNRTGLLTRVITATADRLAQHPSIPADNREAFRLTAQSVMQQQWRELMGGECARVYVPKTSAHERQARNARITAALQAGDDVAQVADREGVSARWVRRLRNF